MSVAKILPFFIFFAASLVGTSLLSNINSDLKILSSGSFSQGFERKNAEYVSRNFSSLINSISPSSFTIKKAMYSLLFFTAKSKIAFESKSGASIYLSISLSSLSIFMARSLMKVLKLEFAA